MLLIWDCQKNTQETVHFLLIFRQAYSIQIRKVIDRNSEVCKCKYSHGYLAISQRRYLINRLRDDVFVERNIAMAEYEG